MAKQKKLTAHCSKLIAHSSLQTPHSKLIRLSQSRCFLADLCVEVAFIKNPL